MADQSIIDTSRHPLSDGVAPDWASGWGEDEYGVFVEITVGDVTQALRWCPPGRFMMGSPEEAERFDDEGPQIEITFARGFWLFETPVTQALYEAVTGENPARFNGADRPVENVSWEEAQAFLTALNDWMPGLELRLPSEAEWEYACRAGSTTPFEPTVAHRYSGASITPDEVNYDGNYPYGDAPKGTYRKETVPVKGRPFRPNAWGLWHMHGNVWEWCADAWYDSHEGASPDGRPRQASQQEGETSRVIRGGSWGFDAWLCRSASRHRLAPGLRLDGLGFRPARGQAPGALASLAATAEPPDAS
ncbi:SUMF1/EgtB/PvdO family nonheme iron enzyme [Rhodovulum sulfidophilum]|uniref:SUMF1/EgtB/PvdO family nonheme iron enzyme n=1 Tax=Rhodovulum sulfidophilum TaxID=35806 RepID=UPI00192F0337